MLLIIQIALGVALGLYILLNIQKIIALSFWTIAVLLLLTGAGLLAWGLYESKMMQLMALSIIAIALLIFFFKALEANPESAARIAKHARRLLLYLAMAFSAIACLYFGFEWWTSTGKTAGDLISFATLGAAVAYNLFAIFSFMKKRRGKTPP